MKIIVISNLYPPFQLGGYEIGCRNVVNGLRELGHDVRVVTSPSHVPPETEERSIRRSLQLNSFQPITSPLEAVRRSSHLAAAVTNYTNTSILLDAISSFLPDCVYFFNLVGIGGLAMIDALNKLDYPWVLHLMDSAPVFFQSGISAPVLALFNSNNGALYEKGTIISMSKHLINEIETTCPISFKRPLNLVPGWADSPSEIVWRPYAADGIFKFVTAGAVQPHKGIDIIIQAIALLKAENVTNFVVEVYGEGKIAHYVDLCGQYGVSDKISFLGSRTQEQLAAVYEESDAFLFPTWEREPFGFAPVEAASVGCVPIITATCGAAERLIGNVHCLKIQRNPKSLSEAMKAVCESRIPLKKIGDQGQTITRQDLSFKSCLKQIEGILDNAATKTKTPKYPTWKDYNQAFLKDNLAKKFTFES